MRRKDGIASFCLYPSTLRMINIANNEGFDEMVSGIEKLLIYKLDSTAKADKSYKEVFTTYRDLEYEEYMTMYGGGYTMYLYGNENRKKAEFVGVFQQEEMAIAFYLRGNIGWAKIPDLIESFESNEMLNILDLNTDNIGNDSHDH